MPTSDPDRVALWLRTREGEAAVRTTLERLRLPMAFDVDLELGVIHAAEQMAAKGMTIDSIGAWSRDCLRWRALDVLKRPINHRAISTRWSGDDVEPGGVAQDPGADDDQLVLVESAHDLGAVRTRLAAQWVTLPGWQLSSAYTVLSVLVGQAECAATCPQPMSGATDIDAAHWAGLWYAGERHLFGDESPAGRQRRSRAIGTVKQLLRSTHDVVDGGDHE